MEVEVEGIVLKETLYGETSKILQVLTKEYGLIGIIAKGASSYKSNLRALSLPFLYANFIINYKENKLSNLKGGKVVKLYGSGSKDIKVYAYISYLCELSYKVLQETNDKEIFNILKNGLDKITEGLNCNVIKNIIVFKYLSYLGISPDLNVCHKCLQKKAFYAIDGKIGGFVCKECYHNEIIIPDNFPRVLNRYNEVNINDIKEIKLDKKTEEIVNQFLNDYYESFSGIYINSKSLIDNIN